MASFKERYTAVYAEMQKMLEELAERALELEKVKDPEGFGLTLIHLLN